MTEEKQRCARCKVARDKNEFRDENKYCNKCLEGQRRYRERNKDKIKEAKQQYNLRNEYCEVCNCTVRKNHLSEHLKTKKHILNIERCLGNLN